MPQLDRAEREKMLESVRAMAWKVVRGPASGIPARDHEDAVQAIMLELWVASERFDPSGPAKFSTFARDVMATVVRRLRDDRVKRVPGGSPAVVFADLGKFEPPAPEPDDRDDEPAVGELADAIVRWLTADALASVTPGVRKYVELAALEGLDAGAISLRTGCPAKTVGRHLREGLEQIARAGHLPAELAAKFGLDAAELAEPRAAKSKADIAARRARVADLTACGLTPSRIADELGVSVDAVLRDKRAARRTPPPPRPAWKSAECAARRAKAVELRAAGVPVDAIAAALGVARSTVVSYLPAGSSARRPGRPRKTKPADDFAASAA